MITNYSRLGQVISDLYKDYSLESIIKVIYFLHSISHFILSLFLCLKFSLSLPFFLTPSLSYHSPSATTSLPYSLSLSLTISFWPCFPFYLYLFLAAPLSFYLSLTFLFYPPLNFILDFLPLFFYSIFCHSLPFPFSHHPSLSHSLSLTFYFSPALLIYFYFFLLGFFSAVLSSYRSLFFSVYSFSLIFSPILDFLPLSIYFFFSISFYTHLSGFLSLPFLLYLQYLGRCLLPFKHAVKL